MAGKILVTGIGGFLGRHVALRFLQAGHQVCGTLRRLAKAEEVRAALRPHLAEEVLRRLCFVEVDLLSDEAWAAAMVDVRAIVHVAGPFVIEEPHEPQDVMRPMVEGTLRVLRMAKASGVDRVVMVSSTSAVLRRDKPGISTEADWPDPEAATSTGFAKAKLAAERAAWDFARAEGMALTVVNPGLMLGPPLGSVFGASVGVVKRVLRGRDPMMPMLGLVMVDVRDVAEALVRVIERPGTAGQRLLLVSGSMTLPEMARLLKEAYPRRRFATMVAPLWLLRLYSLWDAEVAAILPNLYYLPQASNALARAELGMAFIPPAETVRATAEWLLVGGHARASPVAARRG